MKRLCVLLVLVLAATLAVSAQAKKGPIVDKVYCDVRMQEDIGLKDAAAGKTDVFWQTVTGPTFMALPADTRARLDIYSVPTLTYSLLLNPIPNKAPYTWKVGDKESFNPLAIKDVRFALNFLISRKQIVDEILGGAGGPMFSMATPGQPGTYRYNLIASKLGWTAAGNEKKGLTDIANAMARAAELPQLKGKLVKGKQYWEYNGEPVGIKFMIRVDDPSMRLKEGRYISAQLEKAGFKVESLEWDRAKCSNAAYNSNPADYTWQIYTEAWSAGATRAWWDNIVSQMYAPWGGYMPGGSNPDFWNYENKQIDDLSQKAQNGQYLTATEYWQMALQATELGLRDSVRINVCYSQAYQVANKDRFLNRMAYGLGDGLNDWSLKTADVKPEKDGSKVLRMTQFSAKGSLFMSAWDPVGVDGFNDAYSLGIIQGCYDPKTFEAPNTALDTPLRLTWKDVQTKVVKDKEGKLVGQLPVPPTAVLYDSAYKAFRPVGQGKTSFSKGTYTYKFANDHSGRPITIADVMYAQSFIVEWITKDGDDDKYYDAAYESSLRPAQETIKGIVLNPDGTVTVYFDFNHPDANRIGATGGLWTTTFGSSYQIGVNWVISEALAKLVADGGASGTNWSFSSDPAYTEVDVLNPKCLDDIKIKLEDFINVKYVPPQIMQWKNAAEAVQDYQAAIRFIDEHKNAYISNGPFYVSSVDTTANFVELSAFRDPTYPYDSAYWPAFFKSQTTRIDKVDVPSTVAKTRDAVVGVTASIVEYPANTAVPVTAAAKLTATLVLPNGTEKVYNGAFVKAGQLSVRIPQKDLASLKAGSYTLVLQTSLKAEAPSVEVATLVVF